MADTLFFISISVLIIMIASLVGVVFVWKGLGDFLKKNSRYLTTFAGGVFVILAFSMTRETFHLSGSLIVTVASIAAGILLIELIIRLIPTEHHHHSLPPYCDHGSSCIDPRRMIWSDTFHNIGDGILIVGAYTVDVYVGMVATIGIFLHELVQEISEFFVFKEAGYSNKKALSYNFIISGSILIGVALALVLSRIDWLVAPLLGIAAGGFIYVLLRDLIPHTLGDIKRRKTALRHSLVFVAGIVLMFLVNSFAPHAHDYEEDYSHSGHMEESGHDLE